VVLEAEMVAYHGNHIDGKTRSLMHVRQLIDIRFRILEDSQPH
jgi:hypothetical protein